MSKSFMSMGEEKEKFDFRDRKLVFIDLEMSGLDVLTHEVLEIGLVVVEQKSLQVLTKKSIKVAPTKLKDADPVALEIIKFRDEDWKDSVDIVTALNILNDLADKAMLIGWNIAFDWSFLGLSFEKARIKPKFDYHFLDVISLAYIYFKNRNKPSKLSLRTIARELEIKVDDVHGALTDAYATYEVYKKLVQLLGL
ncbi:MAG: 3'-5' exonuclease [Patescibacteria group bacterium]|nr:3'-5' exonuclease [Patescibacteria group bacterium]